MIETLEDPSHPLLGPNLKSLHIFGLTHRKNIISRYMFAILHIASNIFVWTMFGQLYFMEDLKNMLFNLSLSVQSLVCICKTSSLVLYQRQWKELFSEISFEELSQIYHKDPKTMELMRRYKAYSRTVTYSYWLVIILTTIVTITSPFITYSTVQHGNGTIPYPQILSSWFPFDNAQNPGYIVSVVIHVLMIIQGGGIIASYDTTVVVIMTFFKGQLVILKDKCSRIFGEEKSFSRSEVLRNIKECHRLHNFLTEQYISFNSIASPVMSIYVLICSFMICCCVVQLNLHGVTVSQKFWILEYVTAAGVQLFIFCWHSNEITYESNFVDRGIFSSELWKADAKLKKHLILLSGKLSKTFKINAGPMTTLSMPTFIEIIKGAYSFYTLFTKSTNK